MKKYIWMLSLSPCWEVRIAQTLLPVDYCDALSTASSLGGGVWDPVSVLPVRVLPLATVEEEWTEAACSTLLITSLRSDWHKPLQTAAASLSPWHLRSHGCFLSVGPFQFFNRSHSLKRRTFYVDDTFNNITSYFIFLTWICY